MAAFLKDVATSGALFFSSKAEEARQQTIAAATALIHELETPPETLARIGWEEASRTAALQTAFELGILSKLDNETPRSSEELAKGTEADPALVGEYQQFHDI